MLSKTYQSTTKEHGMSGGVTRRATNYRSIMKTGKDKTKRASSMWILLALLAVAGWIVFVALTGCAVVLYATSVTNSGKYQRDCIRIAWADFNRADRQAYEDYAEFVASDDPTKEKAKA